MGGEKPFETSEAIEFAGLVTRFEQPVGIEREAIADLDAERRFLIVDAGRYAEREGARKIKLPIVEEGSGMSGAGDGAFAPGVDAENHAGGEASLESSAEPAVQLGKQSGRGRIVVGKCAHSTHDILHTKACSSPKYAGKDGCHSAFFKRRALETIFVDHYHFPGSRAKVGWPRTGRDSYRRIESGRVLLPICRLQ